MRTLLKSWKNVTEYKSQHNGRHGWTRRMKWYGGDGDFRITFEDETAKVGIVYKSEGEAAEAWEKFKQGASALSMPVR